MIVNIIVSGAFASLPAQTADALIATTSDEEFSDHDEDFYPVDSDSSYTYEDKLWTRYTELDWLHRSDPYNSALLGQFTEVAKELLPAESAKLIVKGHLVGWGSMPYSPKMWWNLYYAGQSYMVDQVYHELCIWMGQKQWHEARVEYLTGANSSPPYMSDELEVSSKFWDLIEVINQNNTDFTWDAAQKALMESEILHLLNGWQRGLLLEQVSTDNGWPVSVVMCVGSFLNPADIVGYSATPKDWRRSALEDIQYQIMDWLWENHFAASGGKNNLRIYEGYIGSSKVWQIDGLGQLSLIKAYAGIEQLNQLERLLCEFYSLAQIEDPFIYNEQQSAGSWFKNLTAISMLERLEQGSVKRLNEEFGIRAFYRYDPQLLVSQLTVGGKGKRNYVLVNYPVADWNDGFADTFYSRYNSIPWNIVNADLIPIFVESEDLQDFSNHVEHVAKLFDEKAAFVLQGGHGTPYSIALSYEGEITSDNVGEYASILDPIVGENTEIVLFSCSTGSDTVTDNIARLISDETGCVVFAPAIDTAELDIVVSNYDVTDVIFTDEGVTRIFVPR